MARRDSRWLRQEDQSIIPAKGKARAWRTSQLAAIRKGEYLDANLGKIKFSEWADAWLASAHHLAESTKARYEIVIRRDLRPAFGARSLVQVSHEDVQGLGLDTSIKAGAAPATVKKSFNVLSAIMSAAVRAGRIRVSMCGGPAPATTEA